MRVSELSRESGAPVATIKYYVREKLLHAGKAVNARESSYDESHVSRLRLIRGLVHILGTSIEQVRQVLRVIDDPDQTVLEAMERATTAIPMVSDISGQAEGPGHTSGNAEALVQRFGFRYDPASPNLRALDTALALGEDMGLSIHDEQIDAYATASRQVAQADFARIPWHEPGQAVPFAVLGTALYEPVLLALRRLAHEELALLRTDRENTDQHHAQGEDTHDEQR